MKRITVTIVRIQQTELEVPDDFELSAQGLRGHPKVARNLARREREDSHVEAIQFELLPDELQPVPVRVPTLHHRVELGEHSVVEAHRCAIEEMYRQLRMMATTQVSEQAMDAVYRLDLTAIHESKGMALHDRVALVMAAEDEWVKRLGDRGYSAFWDETAFVIASPDVMQHYRTEGSDSDAEA